MTSKFGPAAGRSILYGALGFGLGLALAGATLGAITFRLNDFNTSVSVEASLFALGGAIGGTLLGLAGQTRSRLGLFAIVAAAAFGAGYFLLTSLYSIYFERIVSGEMAVTAAFVFQFALIGGFAGAMMGAVQRAWDQAIRLGLAGALGFGLGFWLQDVTGTWINGPASTLAPGTLGEPAYDSIALAIIFGTSFALAGIVGGAALGMAFTPGVREKERPGR